MGGWYQVVECPIDPKDWHQIMEIKPRDLNESLIIDLELMCDCPCEKSGHPVGILKQRSYIEIIPPNSKIYFLNSTNSFYM